MRTRTLGPLDVTVVGLGCNNFGGRVDEAGTRAVVDAALEAGVTFFDTADIYGNAGGSEKISATGPFQWQRGPYTHYGNVTPLLKSPDNQYVIFGSGEEIDGLRCTHRMGIVE